MIAPISFWNGVLIIPLRVTRLRKRSLVLGLLMVLACFLAGTRANAQGEKVLYKTETIISQIQGTGGRPVGTMSASAGTIIVFDSRINGLPIFIAFSEAPKWLVQGKYGIDVTGRPENKGRLIYRSDEAPIPYVVTGQKDIYSIYFSYLELTTVENSPHGSTRAFAIKAIASNNIVKSLSRGTLEYRLQLPRDNHLDIVNGEIKIEDNYIVPNYDLTGDISTELDQQVNNPGSATGQAGSAQTPKNPGKPPYLYIALGITGGLIILVLLALFVANRRRGRVPQVPPLGPGM